jgi:hypothetical protein
VTGDDTCVSYFQPEMKWAGKEMQHASSPKPETFHMQTFVEKVMLTLFWEHQDPLVEP